MSVLVSGSTGMIGSVLVRSLSAGGRQVIRLVRSEPAGPAEVRWDPAAGRLDLASLQELEAVVHLAGESIARGRWTAARKARIRDSRVRGTSLLSAALAALDQPPKVMVCASATGYYGDRGEEILDEQSRPGDGFLPEVTRAWEAAAQPAAAAGIRVVNLRFGMVLSRSGGALARMLPVFRLGAGGALGSGRQYVSWIALDDAVGSIEHALARDELEGPVNAVSPSPVTNREFARALGRVLGRPALLRTPAFVLRLVLGELAEGAVLASVRALPTRLSASGYEFRHPELQQALHHALRADD